MNDRLVDFSCPICRSGDCSFVRPYLAITDHLKDRSIVECSKCSTISMHPCVIESTPEEYYEMQYWTDEKFARRSPSLRAQAYARCSFMSSGIYFNSPLRVLDVGAGVGYMNWGFREVWSDVETEYTAIEVNPAALKFLHADPGVNHVFNSLDDIYGEFDIVVLSHILEHITEPADFLSKIKSLLSKPHGCLFVEVPCLDFRFKKRNEPHVLFFSPGSLSQLITRQGFKALRIATCGHSVWKLKADSGLISRSLVFSLRRFLYQLSMRHNSEFQKYGGDRQWIRALCKIDKDGR